jgi:hypothetical protein
VNKGVLRTIFRLDEAKALAHVEEFDCSGNHLLPFQGASRKPYLMAAGTAYIAHIVRRSLIKSANRFIGATPDMCFTYLTYMEPMAPRYKWYHSNYRSLAEPDAKLSNWKS